MHLCRIIRILFVLFIFSGVLMAQEGVVYYSTEPPVLRADGSVDGEVVRRMVDALVMALTGKSTVAQAWGTWVRPEDRVGIKVATEAGSVAGTHLEVVRAIVEGLREAGVQHIVVWDRRQGDLQSAGFSSLSKEYRLAWTEGGEGYDKEHPLPMPLLGRIISGDLAFEQRHSKEFKSLFQRGEEPLSETSYPSRILTREVDKIINVPSLTDSFFTGLAGAIANMSVGNIDNWRRLSKPPQYGDPYIAELYADALIRDKVVLTVMDGLTLQFAGGPRSNPDYARPHHTLFAGTDPVAVDALALKLLNEYRLPEKLPPIRAEAAYIQSAEEIGLGQSDPEKVELQRVHFQ